MLTGRQKAAILLITLGPEVSAEIFKHLRDDEIEQLTLEIANVRKVDSAEKEMIMAEFHQICLAQEYITQGGITYAKEILEKALGQSKALDIINRLTATLQVRPFDFARKADPNQILNFIQNENAQTIALVLSYLQFEQAAAILSSLPQEKQAEVARRIAVMDSTSPEVISQVERVLEQKLSATVTQDYTSAGGIESIAADFERGRPGDGKDDSRFAGNSRSGAGRGNQKADVCFRRYRQHRQPLDPTDYSRYRKRRSAACPQSGQRRSPGSRFPQHVETDVRDVQGRNGIHGTCAAA